MTVENIRYTAYIVTDTKKYNVTNALVTINTSEEEKQLAESVSLGLVDVDVDGKKLSDIVKLRHRVILRASDGKKSDEIYQGYVWALSPKESLTDAEVTIKSYDQLIYWQESEDAAFFPAGQPTSAVVKTVADKWGIKISYDYGQITHDQLVLRGAISDFLTADLLDTVKSRTGKKYVIRDEKGTVAIRSIGVNTTVYTIDSKQNATELRRYCTLNGVITQVIVISTAGDDEKTRVEATSRRFGKEYGTLQKIVTRSESTPLSEAMAEAQNIVLEKGKPQWEYDIKAVNIPWIRKGDVVNVRTDTLRGKFIVKAISREISNRGSVMTLTLVDA